jgi:hypothetical protein
MAINIIPKLIQSPPIRPPVEFLFPLLLHILPSSFFFFFFFFF